MGKQSIDLAQFDADFQSEATEERGDFESVPDGKYQVAVEKVELTQSSDRQPDVEVDAAHPGAALRKPVPVAQQRLHAKHAEVREDGPAPLRARPRKALRTCRST